MDKSEELFKLKFGEGKTMVDVFRTCYLKDGSIDLRKMAEVFKKLEVKVLKSEDDKIRYDIAKKELFEDLLQIQNEEDGEFNIKEFDARFEVGNGNELKLRYENLKNAMDITFFSEVNADIRKLKICKYCNKPFIAENPKAEYDKHSCKNRANVYKFRSRQK